MKGEVFMRVDGVGIVSDLDSYNGVEAELESQATEETLEDEAQPLPEKDVSWLRDVTSRYPKTALALGALTVFGVGVGISFWAREETEQEDEKAYWVKKDLVDLTTNLGFETAQTLWQYVKEESQSISKNVLSRTPFTDGSCREIVKKLCDSYEYLGLSRFDKEWCSWTWPDGEEWVKGGFTSAECKLTDEALEDNSLIYLSSRDESGELKEAFICSNQPSYEEDGIVHFFMQNFYRCLRSRFYVSE